MYIKPMGKIKKNRREVTPQHSYTRRGGCNPCNTRKRLIFSKLVLYFTYNIARIKIQRFKSS